MAWDRAWDRLASWSRQLLAAAVATGPVPHHLAFIMDGNRRFAEQRHLRRVEGHQFGYLKLIDALEWCLELGVECVSVYAFSIDNYKRSRQEVNVLMDLAEQKLSSMLQEMEVLRRRGVQVRVLGDLGLVPLRVQQAAAQVMDATRQHSRAVLNICFSYTASQELLQALDRAGMGAASGSDSSMFLDAQMYTQGCPPVDLVIRTSGETRLSDFLLWQSRRALLVFSPVLWPDFGFWDLLAAVVEFQLRRPALERLRLAEAAGVRAAAAAMEARGQRWLRLRQHHRQGQQGHRQQRQQEEEVEPSALPLELLPGGPAVDDADAVCMLGLGSDVAVVKAFELGGESPRAIASPDSPSSPSVHSGDGGGDGGTMLLLPLPPRWEERLLRSLPSSGSVQSLAGGSPRALGGGASSGNGSGNAFLKLCSPSSHRLGSVDSFSSIDLYGDGNGSVPRQRLSYQDLGDALG